MSPQIPELTPEERSAATSTSLDQAWAEAEFLSRKLPVEALEHDAMQREHGRNERFRDAFEFIAIATLYIGFIALSVLALIWALHLVIRKEYRWLSAEDLTHIQTLLTAGVLVGVVGNHFKKRLNDEKKSGS